MTIKNKHFIRSRISEKKFREIIKFFSATTHIVLSPLDFLSRLASLIPRPRVHLIRFHGVFAPHCKYRSLVTPDHSNEINTISRTEQKKQKKSYSMGWAKMLKRVFDIDIQICSKCGGQIKIISSIHNPLLIKRILTHLGENAKIPELSPLTIFSISVNSELFRPSGNRRESC